MKKNNTIKINLAFIIVIILFFCLAILKLSYITISKNIDGIDLEKFANNRNTTKKTLYATRGSIYDTNGNYLAQTVNSYTVIAYLSSSRTTDPNNPHHVIAKEETATKIAEVLNANNIKADKDQILALLNWDKYQVEIARGISELVKDKIEELDLPGIDFVASSKRYYQMDNFASYIVGYAKNNDEGKLVGEMGIESYFNEVLTGSDGYSEYQTDTYGYKLPNSSEFTVASKSGANIYLTIDNNIQMFLEQEISNLTKDYEMSWITFSVADAKTGAILGSASSPSFNPNKLNITSYLNPLVSYQYEPGSTMKIYSWMASMENNLYDGSNKYQSGSITIDDYTIHDFNDVGWGKITYDEGFAYSSNTGASYLALDLGRDKLQDFYDSLGFGKKTGITLPNESSGKIDFYYDVELATAAFGHGITTTPIQNIQALTTVANDGVMLKPYIVEKIVDPTTNDIIYEGGRTEVNKVASSSTIEKMQSLMYDAIYSNKTDAKYYQPKMVEVIGKTGTAQIASPSGGYLTGKYDYIRSFAGLFPANEPQYIIYISVKQFVGSISTIAKSVTNVIDEIAKYKNIVDTISSVDNKQIITLASYLNTDTIETATKLKYLKLQPIILGDGKYIVSQYPKKNSKLIVGTKVFLKTNNQEYTMPDAVGWSSNEIITFANLIGINYHINGYGKVVSTSISTNSKIDLNTTLEIYLEP